MQSNKTTIIITTAILILTILTAGCTDTGGVNPEAVEYTPPPQEVAVVEETAAVVEDIPEPVETPWYDGRDYYTYTTIQADDNLFGVDIEGVKYDKNTVGFIFYDMDQNRIFQQQIYTSSYPLHNELSPDQYRTLIDQYGSMISVTMETIDLDQDGAMDKVAVKYVGTDSEWVHYFEYHDDARVEDYIGAKLNPELYPMLKEIYV